MSSTRTRFPRAAWFKAALARLLDFVSQVPGLFIDAINPLTLEDIILLPRAFMKVATVFRNFVGNFVTWAGKAVWTFASDYLRSRRAGSRSVP